MIFNSKKNKFFPISKYKLNFYKDYINEYLIIDTLNEGKEDKFNFEILEKLNIRKNKLIISGGVGPKVIKIAKKNKISSVIIENRNFYKELNNFKKNI